MAELAMQLNLWINKKNKKEYQVIRPVINATNAQDGEEMVLYTPNIPGADTYWYVREFDEFYKKFEKK